MIAAVVCLCMALSACGQKKEEGGSGSANAPAPAASGTVTVVDEDNKTEIPINGATVEEVLKAAGIELGNFDQTEPDRKEAVKDGDTITIKRAEIKTETKTEEIPFDVQEAYSDTMASGESTVTQAGQNGQKEVTYNVAYIDGKEVKRKAVEEKVIKEAVPQIVTYGTGQGNQQQGGDGGKYEVSREAFPNCADGSHGYYDITYSDGSHEYVEY